MTLTRAFSKAVCRGEASGVEAREGTGSPVAGALCVSVILPRPGFRLEEGQLAAVTVVVDDISKVREESSFSARVPKLYHVSLVLCPHVWKKPDSGRGEKC